MDSADTVLNATRDLVLPAAVRGSRPSPPRFGGARAINLGADIVRLKLELPEVEIPAADPRYTFSG